MNYEALGWHHLKTQLGRDITEAESRLCGIPTLEADGSVTWEEWTHPTIAPPTAEQVSGYLEADVAATRSQLKSVVEADLVVYKVIFRLLKQLYPGQSTEALRGQLKTWIQESL